jgi:2-amino-4-hydroxy-6-hydroxymethyldihydropteridine diphosphokinase
VIIVGLGGNLGGEAAVIERFRRAREAFEQLGETRAAPLYRTTPIGPAQELFLNSALRVRIPDVLPAELIATTLEIERLLGRDRRTEARNGPRAIDLDILVWGDRVIRTPELEVPHPRLAGRRFALEPLVALVGDAFELPGLGAAGPLLARVRDQTCELVSERW